MPLEGFTSLTMDDETVDELDRVKDLERCRTRSETLRLLLRIYRKTDGGAQGGHTARAPAVADATEIEGPGGPNVPRRISTHEVGLFRFWSLPVPLAGSLAVEPPAPVA